MLTAARDLVAAAWTQHADARSADGAPIDPWDSDAVSWSLLGSLVAGYEQLVRVEGQGVALEALVGAAILLAGVVESDSLAGWNDAPGRTQADVLAALDEAVAHPLPSPPLRHPLN